MENTTFNLYDKFQKLVGADTLEIFGKSGTGKTTFTMEVAKSYVAKGKKVLYIDTEKNFLKKPENIDYEYFSKFEDAYRFIVNLNKKYDLVILDSMGLPILGAFASLNLKERGEILLKSQAISYKFKTYCQANNATVIVLNQPVSDFGKSAYEVRDPFGDKSIYFYKEVWKTRHSSTGPTLTEIVVETHRSRFKGREAELFRMSITDKGATITPKI